MDFQAGISRKPHWQNPSFQSHEISKINDFDMPLSLEFALKVLGDRSPQLVPLVPKAFLHDVGALSEEMLAVLGAFGISQRTVSPFVLHKLYPKDITP